MVAGCLLRFLRSHEVAACLSLFLLGADVLSLSLPVLYSCCMCLTVSCCAGCLSLSLWSHGVAAYLSVSYGYWLSLTVPLTAIELLHVSQCLLWLLAVSHCLSGLVEFIHVFYCLFRFHGVAACLSLSLVAAGCL